MGAKTRLYFYWGMGTTLAEETDGQGATVARYLIDGSDTVAQETYRVSADGHRDPTDTAGTWTWLSMTLQATWPPTWATTELSPSRSPSTPTADRRKAGRVRPLSNA